MFALPVWGGFLSADHINKINTFSQRLKRFGYITCSITVTAIKASHLGHYMICYLQNVTLATVVNVVILSKCHPTILYIT